MYHSEGSYHAGRMHLAQGQIWGVTYQQSWYGWPFLNDLWRNVK